jgi:oxygen-independent coproporphyrinogen-3 oxidase
VRELELQHAYLGRDLVDTIYFGGGTPSLLNRKQIERILIAVSDHYYLAEQVELTLEANPDDLTPSSLEDLYQLGINRLSIGIQSFNQQVLTWMNRAHTTQQALDSIAWSRKAGFDNINVDLIYGIPLPDYQLEEDLSRVISLMPQHISAYTLTIEPRTVFGHQMKHGLLTEIDEEDAATCFQMVMDGLRSAGYAHYEISNFSLPGKQSNHNLGYWRGQSYLGIGPSAHSFDGKSRQFNIANNALYIKALQDSRIPFTREDLSSKQRVNEMIMLGLRTSEGVNIELQAGDLHWNLLQQNAQYLQLLQRDRFAIIEKNKLILTDKGKLIADRISEDLFVGIGE